MLIEGRVAYAKRLKKGIVSESLYATEIIHLLSLASFIKLYC